VSRSWRMTRRRSGAGRAKGVTLLELLAAVAILGLIATLLYGTFSRTLLVRDRATVSMERYATARAAFAWLEQDLEGSFGVGLYPRGAKRFFSPGSADTATLGGAPLLDVTTTSARSTTPLSGTAPPLDEIEGLHDRGDQARVLYHLEAPADDPDARTAGFDLVRYEYRPPTSADLEDAARAVIAHGIRSVELRFFDGGQWHESWDSTGTSGVATGIDAGGASDSGAESTSRGGIAPKIVETRLRLDDGNGGVIELVSAVYLTMGGRHG
jgi:prepilin-type N-terminal cleavage/methylation domain-containing protein